MFALESKLGFRYLRPMLVRFADDVFTVTREQRFWGVETGTRMTVVRLSDGGLLVHCPVALDDATRAEVDALGPVKAVVASSLFHHLYVGEWMKAYPEASFHPCPGLAEKRSDLRWGTTLGDEPLLPWEADVDQAAFTSRFEREVVFFHKKSHTLICADALLNLSEHPSRTTRFLAMLMRNTGPGKGYLEHIAVRDKALGRRQVQRILQWNIDGVVLAHGELLHHGGSRAVEDAYSWIL